MACRAGRNCITKNVWAKVYLGKADVQPPERHYLALLHDDGTEVSGPSYRRERLRLSRGDKGYHNDAPISIKAQMAEENWGTVALSRIVTAATPTDAECTCFTARMDRPRRVEAGDILSWGRADFRVRLGGRITSHAAQVMEDFVFGGIDFAPPSAFYAGLFTSRPNPDKFVELLSPDYQRVPIRFRPGRDGLTPYVSHDVRWTATGDWDISGLGIFDSQDPYSPDGHLWSWRSLPYGGRIAEKGDEVVQLAGTWGLA